MSDPRVTVIVVAFDGREYVERCLASLAGQEPHELIVVDNGSTDGTREFLERRLGAALLKLNNPGFGAANNFAARRARGRYLLFLNSDCELAPGAIATLATTLDRYPSIWAAAPRLHTANGGFQRSAGRRPTLFTELLNKTMAHRILPFFTYGRWRFTGDRTVDWVTGACMLMRASAFARIGGFDERFFMFMEDLDLCARVRASGGQIRFTDTAAAVHHGGASSTDLDVRARMLAEGERASRLYFAKHHGPRAALAVRWMTLVTAGARWILWLALLAVPRYQDRALARIRAYPVVIREACRRNGAGTPAAAGSEKRAAWLSS
jgi:GT2 family glycosyltransferase